MPSAEEMVKEYAVQFFDIVPGSLVDELNEEAMDLMDNCLDAMKKQILKKYSFDLTF